MYILSGTPESLGTCTTEYKYLLHENIHITPFEIQWVLEISDKGISLPLKSWLSIVQDIIPL